MYYCFLIFQEAIDYIETHIKDNLTLKIISTKLKIPASFLKLVFMLYLVIL